MYASIGYPFGIFTGCVLVSARTCSDAIGLVRAAVEEKQEESHLFLVDSISN
jgi:hypothetical protein